MCNGLCAEKTYQGMIFHSSPLQNWWAALCGLLRRAGRGQAPWRRFRLAANSIPVCRVMQQSWSLMPCYIILLSLAHIKLVSEACAVMPWEACAPC